jgi:uncharacterized secreted protein with C-terminal beta-propeller domain
MTTKFTRRTMSVAIMLPLAMLMLVSCGGGSAENSVAPPEPVGMLRLVRNAAELETSLKAGIRSAPTFDVATASAGQVSGTYTQEARVDEFDVVRYDGNQLYIAPQRAVTCCFLIDPIAQPAGVVPPTTPRAIRILRTDPVTATARSVGSIPLENNVSVQGLYVTGGRAVALTSEAYFGSYGGFWTGLPFWAPTHFGVRIFDVSNPATPRALFTATMDGVFVESRRIGDQVYVISRYSPQILLDPLRNSALDSTPLSALLPQITIDGVKRPLVDPARCYVTSDDSDANGYAVITSITVIPVSNPAAFSTTCYNESAYGVYVSEQAIYLTEPRYQATTASSRTRIHKFEIAGAAPLYRGSAEIDGAVWTGGQADFRLSEYNGQLRVMTSEFLNDPLDNVDHRLFVLRQKPNAPALEVVAQLPNTRRPEEIGKPNEALYGVRFLGTRAYAVTFRRIDPLYVLDLSAADDPLIAGSLDIPGFSDFLHPVSDKLLLGLGQADNGGVRLALFDVSTLGRPRELGGITLGGRGSWSEARNDRHAFTYLADVASVDRFAIPVNLFSEDGLFRFQESALNLFEIRNKATANLASLQAVGKIVARNNTAQKPATPIVQSRAFIHDNAVFYIADDEVWGAMWATPSSVNGPF